MRKIAKIIIWVALGGMLIYSMVDNPTGWENEIYIKAFVIGMTIIFAFNLIGRNFVVFKPYFLSPMNLLTSQHSFSFQYDLSRQLMYEKLKEAIENSSLRLRSANNAKYELFATSSLSFKSWGENVYLEINEISGGSEVVIHSVAISQIEAWGKNGKNIENVMQQFEESLIV